MTCAYISTLVLSTYPIKNKEQVNGDDYRQLDGDSIHVPSGKIWFSPKVGDAPLDFNFNANSCQFLKDHSTLSFQISGNNEANYGILQIPYDDKNGIKPNCLSSLDTVPNYLDVHQNQRLDDILG